MPRGAFGTGSAMGMSNVFAFCGYWVPRIRFLSWMRRRGSKVVAFLRTSARQCHFGTAGWRMGLDAARECRMRGNNWCGQKDGDMAT